MIAAGSACCAQSSEDRALEAVRGVLRGSVRNACDQLAFALKLDPQSTSLHRAAGAALLAHELAHVAQQRHDGPRLQRRSADVTMPEARISAALRPIDDSVRGLSALTTPPAPGEVISERSDEDAPDPAQRLPFTDGGWESGEILTRLGQFDALPGTDSDANRCVQAVAMASHIVEGPDAVKQYLVEHGVAANRITTEGLGESKPVASNATAEGRAQNRRVELHLR